MKLFFFPYRDLLFSLFHLILLIIDKYVLLNNIVNI